MSICGKWKLKDVETTVQRLQESTLLFRDIPQSSTDLSDLELSIELIPHPRMPSILISLFAHNETLCTVEHPLNGLVSRSKDEEYLDLAFIKDVDQNLFEFKILHFITDNSDIKRVETYSVEGEDRMIYVTNDASIEFTRHGSNNSEDALKNVAEDIAQRTYGWDKVNFWPSLFLATTQMKITEALSEEADRSPVPIWSSNPVHQNNLKSKFPSDFTVEDSKIKLLFKFQLSYEDSSWQLLLSLNEIKEMNNFMLQQNPPTEDEDSIITKLSSKRTWKAYLDFHKFVIHVENMFRGYLQHAGAVPYACISLVIEALQISSHVHEKHIRYVEGVIGQEIVNANFSWPQRIGLVKDDNTAKSSHSQPGSAEKKSPSASKRPSLMSIKKERGGENFHLHHHDDHRHNSSTVTSVLSSDGNEYIGTKLNNDSPDDVADNPVTDVPRVIFSTPPEKPKHIDIPPPILVNKTSADAGDFNDIYMPSPSLRYMPVELVGSSSVKLSIAKGLLSHALGRGISVKKFGRQGKPKRKRLFCNPQVTVLMWQPDIADDEEETKDVRFINISDIKSIRLGTEIDPITTETALQHALEYGEIHQSDYINVQEIKQKEGIVDKPGQKSNFLSNFFMGGKEKDVVLYGTAILRRSCKAEEMKLCISFILEDRTFDIQCSNQRDLDTLRINLNELISNNVPKNLTEKPPSLYIEANDNPLMAARKKMMSKKAAAAKKSVRFSTDANDVQYDTNNGIFDEPNLELGVKSASGDSCDVMYLHDDIENLDKLVDHSKNSHLSNIAQHMHSTMEVKVDEIEISAKTTASSVADSNSNNTNEDHSFISMTSIEALQIGLILSEQEKMYGTNMYESLQPSDETQIAKYVAKGYTAEEAIMRIFEKKFVPKHEMRLAHMSRTASEMNSSVGKNQPEISAEGEASYDLNDDGSIVKTVFSFDEQILQAAAAREEEDEEEEAAVLANRSMEDAGRKSSFFPDFKSELRAASIESNNGDGQLSQRFSRIYSSDALQIGLLLAQQEEKYGTNMFVSFSKDDQEELNQLKENGMTTDQAAMEIFKRKCDDGEILPLVVSVEGESTDTGAEISRAGITSKNEQSTDGGTTTAENTTTTENTKSENIPKISTRGDELLSPFTPSPVRTNSSFFPSSTSVLPNNTKLNPNPPAPGAAPASSVGDVHKEKALRRMSSYEAMNLALLLSEQETMHGVNMYDSLTPSDEPTIQAFVASGIPLEHAILTVFTNKYGESTQNTNLPSPSNSGTASTYPSTLSIIPTSDPRIGYPAQQAYPNANPAYPYYNPSSYSPYYPYGYSSQPSPYPYGYGQASYPPYDPYVQPAPCYYPPSPYYPYPYQVPASTPNEFYSAPSSQIQQASVANAVVTATPITGRPSMQSSTSRLNTATEPSPAPARRPSIENSSPGGQRRPSVSGATAQRRPSQRSGSQPGSPAMAQRRPSATRTASTSSNNPETLQRNSSILNMIFGSSSSKGEIKCKEADIKAITKMGFSREQAIWALSQNDQNVTLALNSLTR